MLKGKLRLLLWAACLLLPVPAMAISLGDLVVRSMPGEPLRAHIPMLLEQGESLSTLRVSLADVSEYERRRMPRPPLLDTLAIALLDKGEGKGRIQLFSDSSWQGEGVDILLQLRWPGGELEQQFALMALDADEDSTPVYAEVAENESLDAIAMRLSKERNRSYLHMMYALFKANPDAFYRGNINNLKGGATLRVPTNKELYRYTDAEVYNGLREQNQAWQQQRSKQVADKQAEEAMEQRLQQVVDEGEAIRQENEALRARLKQLEQRMHSVAGRVLDYAEDEPTGESQSQSEADPVPSAPAEEKAQQPGKSSTDKAEMDKPERELSGSALFSAMVLALLFAFYIWFSAGHKHRGRK